MLSVIFCLIRFCSVLTAAVRDFPRFGESVIRMYSGDCDQNPDFKVHKYSIESIYFNYLPWDGDNDDDTPAYTLSGEHEQRVADAFSVDRNTGDIIVTLPDYRPYSFGKFDVTVKASDSMGRSDTSRLSVSFFTRFICFQYFPDSEISHGMLLLSFLSRFQLCFALT